MEEIYRLIGFVIFYFAAGYASVRIIFYLLAFTITLILRTAKLWNSFAYFRRHEHEISEWVRRVREFKDFDGVKKQ